MNSGSPKHHPADPPKLPTEDDISQLPPWAQVAFAARCARRVQPLIHYHWRDAPPEAMEAVEMAITLAESISASPSSAGDKFHAATEAAEAVAAVVHAAAAGSQAALAAAEAAAFAAAAAAAYVNAAHGGDAHAAAATAATIDAAYAAADAAPSNSANGEISRDFQSLLSAAEQGQWSDDTPFPPSHFGSLWPDGTPESWPGQSPTETWRIKDSALRLMLHDLPMSFARIVSLRAVQRAFRLFQWGCWDGDAREYWLPMQSSLVVLEEAASGRTDDATALAAARRDIQQSLVDAIQHAMAVATARRVAAAAQAVADSFALWTQEEESQQEKLAEAIFESLAAIEYFEDHPGAPWARAAADAVHYDLVLATGLVASGWDNTGRLLKSLGPLWQKGEPSGWLPDPDGYSHSSQSLSLYFDLDDFTPAEIARAIETLSDVYHDMCGDELIIDSTSILEFARVPEGAKS